MVLFSLRRRCLRFLLLLALCHLPTFLQGQDNNSGRHWRQVTPDAGLSGERPPRPRLQSGNRWSWREPVMGSPAGASAPFEGRLQSPRPAPATAEKEIALTFDDLPAVGPFGYWEPREISNMILRTLEEHHIRAAGFVVQERVDDDPATEIVLEDWISRGHLLGNQTYSDVDLNQLGVEDFIEHVADGQKGLKRLSRSHPFNYRYLRYPFLHQGDTKRKKKKVAKTLYNAGYQIAHVTVKTSDYHFNSFYIENERDPAALSRLKRIFLEHVADSLEYSEIQSQQVFHRNIRHILWLHCGIATASFLEDLIEWLLKRGYRFISLPQALEDPAYQSKDEYVGPLSLSFIDRIAASRGLDFDPKRGELSAAQIRRLLKRR